jgi:poly(hydroxyalkanoate) granule-associated protein
MRKQAQTGKSDEATPKDPFSDHIKASAQQIWLAGLGAFTKAQAEGTKVFDTLVKEGMAMQQNTQAVAEQRLSEVTHKVSSLANDLGAKATGQWDKLETIFEDRVAKALGRLGMPTSAELDALKHEVEVLREAVARLTSPKSTSRAAKVPRKAVRHKLPPVTSATSK